VNRGYGGTTERTVNMGRKKSTGEKPEKKTATKVRPIPRKHAGKVTEPWSIMERLIAECEFFAPLKDAKIKLWWQKDWKADVDGIATGAQVCKASEIDRNLVEESGSGETVDVFIKLPEAQWPGLDDIEKEHRLFHQLCHVKPAKDSNGKQKRDTKDRLLWRLGRHPIAAFHEEVARYGVDKIIGHNGAVLAAIAHTNRPMEALFDAAEKTDGNGESSAPSKAWRRWNLQQLTNCGFPDGKRKLLEEAGIDTMGKLIDKMNRQGSEDFWWKDVKGFGESGYDAR
jgi:hypothetical protein